MGRQTLDELLALSHSQHPYEDEAELFYFDCKGQDPEGRKVFLSMDFKTATGKRIVLDFNIFDDIIGIEII